MNKAVTWIVALALSLVIHALFALNIREPSNTVSARAGSQTVSIAGSLADVVGQTSLAAVKAVPAPPITPLQTTTERALNPLRPTSATPARPTPQSATRARDVVEPVVANEPQSAVVVTNAVTPRAEDAKPVVQTERLLPKRVAPTKPTTVRPKKVRPKPRRSKQASQPKKAQRKRASSAGKKAMRGFARRVSKALSRTRPKRVAGSGTVIIVFTVSPRGGLASLRVQKSSGSARIDRAARRAVRRARLPKPPNGATRAQRSFVIPYHFRK